MVGARGGSEGWVSFCKLVAPLAWRPPLGFRGRIVASLDSRLQSVVRGARLAEGRRLVATSVDLTPFFRGESSLETASELVYHSVA